MTSIEEIDQEFFESKLNQEPHYKKARQLIISLYKENQLLRKSADELAKKNSKRKIKNLLMMLMTSFTYKITTYSDKVEQEIIDDGIQQGFKMWSDATPLEFKQVKKNQDISIEFLDNHICF